MKPSRVGEDEAAEKVNMADVLQLLLPPRRVGGGAQVMDHHHRPVIGRRGAFKCKTCNRRFPSFQALGGHSTSHRKTKPPPPPPPGGVVDLGCPKPKVHGCSVCGLEFAMGQALGGHMRRHRSAGLGEQPQPRCEDRKLLASPPLSAAGAVGLDLNLPPVEDVVVVDDDDDVGLLTLGLAVQHDLKKRSDRVGGGDRRRRELPPGSAEAIRSLPRSPR